MNEKAVCISSMSFLLVGYLGTGKHHGEASRWEIEILEWNMELGAYYGPTHR